MEFEFKKNLQGFESSQSVNLNIIKHHGDTALMCRCRESCDLPGVIRKVKLPQISEYLLKIDGQADNNRTFLSLTDEKGRSLITKPIV